MGRDTNYSIQTLEETQAIPISFLRKEGYLSNWKYGTIVFSRGGTETGRLSVKSEGDYISKGNSLDEKFEVRGIRFIYTSTDRYTEEKVGLDYIVSLSKSKCNLGGYRYYFLCPLSTNGIPCGRRVATLYFGGRGRYLGCRHCYKLRYDKQRHSEMQKRFKCFEYSRKAEELYEKISTFHYKGKPTRSYKRYLKYQKKSEEIPIELLKEYFRI